MMTRLFLAAIVSATLAAPTQAAEKSILGAVREVRPVRLEADLNFRREGETIKDRDLILIRVRIDKAWKDFEPRGISEPLFVLGSTVCVVIQSPFVTGEAVLLAPRSASPADLWMTDPGVVPKRLTSARTRQLRSRSASRNQLRVTAPAAGTEARTYRNAGEVWKAIRAEGAHDPQ